VILLILVPYVAKFSPWWHQLCFSIGSHLVLWPASPRSPDFGNCNFLHYKKCCSWHGGRLLWNHEISELNYNESIFCIPSWIFLCYLGCLICICLANMVEGSEFEFLFVGWEVISRRCRPSDTHPSVATGCPCQLLGCHRHSFCVSLMHVRPLTHHSAYTPSASGR
jgi:hypothetical protein